MKNQEESMEKLLTIEKTITGMIELHRLVVELKELETQHQKTIEVLRASETKYRTFLENIPLKLFVKDRNFYYLYGSESYARDLKIRPEEIAGKTDYDFFPGDWAEKYTSDDKRIMETGRLEHIEDKYVVDDESFIVHMVKTPIRDEKGISVGILGIFWDVTEQRHNEEESKKHLAHLEELLSERTGELQKTNERLRGEEDQRRQVEDQLWKKEEEGQAIFENPGTAMAIIGNDDMMVLRTNTEFEKLFGIPREEVEEKKRLAEFIAGEDLERVREQYFAARTTGEAAPRSQEYRFIDSEGNRKDFSLTMAMIPATKKIVASLLDITERVQLEKDFQRSEERHRWLVENANIGIAVIQDGTFKFVNPKGVEIFGYSQEELSSRAASEFIHPDDRELFELQVRELSDDGVPRVFFLKILPRGGATRWLENKIAFIHWEGRPAAMNFITDVTGRKQAEDELLNSISPFRAVVDAAQKILAAK